MSFYEQPEDPLDKGLSEAWSEPAETDILRFHRLGHVASLYGDEPVTPNDLAVIRNQLEGPWYLDFNFPTNIGNLVLAAREVDEEIALGLNFATHNRRGDGRRRVFHHGKEAIVMLAKGPLLASDASVLYHVESDVLVGPRTDQSERGNSTNYHVKVKGEALKVNKKTADILNILFTTPREEIHGALGLSVQEVGSNLGRAARLHNMDERAFYTKAFKEGFIPIPDTVLSTESVIFTDEEFALIDLLPLPRKAGQLTAGYGKRRLLAQFAPIFAKLGVETPEQALLVVLRDKHYERRKAAEQS